MSSASTTRITSSSPYQSSLRATSSRFSDEKIAKLIEAVDKAWEKERILNAASSAGESCTVLQQINVRSTSPQKSGEKTRQLKRTSYSFNILNPSPSFYEPEKKRRCLQPKPQEELSDSLLEYCANLKEKMIKAMEMRQAPEVKALNDAWENSIKRN